MVVIDGYQEPPVNWLLCSGKSSAVGIMPYDEPLQLAFEGGLVHAPKIIDSRIGGRGRN